MKLKIILASFTLLIFLIIALVSYYLYDNWHQAQHQRIVEQTQNEALVWAHDLSFFIKNQKKPVATLAKMPAIQELLEEPQSRHRIEQANQLLQLFCETLEALTCYVMDPQGLTIAASNYRQDNSFIGNNYGFRPYFKMAMEGVAFTYLAIGITSRKRGIYFSHPVWHKGGNTDAVPQISGVVVVKYALDNIEDMFSASKGITMLVDSQGSVIASNQQYWLYKQLWDSPAGNGMLITDPDNEQIVVDMKQQRYLYSRQVIENLLGWEIVYLRLEQQALKANDALLHKVLNSWLIIFFISFILMTLFLYQAARKEMRARERIERQLRLAKQQAEASSRAKSEFLSRMSHELRTPLNAILGFAQLMQMSQLDELQKDNVNEIIHGGKHLLQLINEILDLSRIESGEMHIEMECVALLPLLQQVLPMLKIQAAEQKVEIHVEVGDCQVKADPMRLKQVFINLLGNAVKYNIRGGRVDIAIRQMSAERIAIEISDTGIGMAKNELEKLFRPFEPVAQHQQDGLGIGLVISRHLIQMMSGELRVSSQSGAGSIFTIILQGCEQMDSIKASEPEKNRGKT